MTDWLPPPIEKGGEIKHAMDNLMPVHGRETTGVIDMGFEPRDVQKRMYSVLNAYHNAIIVLHRRAGKTVGLLQWIIKEIWKWKLADIERERPGKPPRWLYAAPTGEMAKRIVMDTMVDAQKKIPGTRIYGGQKPKMTFPNSGIIEILGTHNPDAMRGTYLDGAVLDEYAFMNPDVYHSVLRPQMMDYNGRTVMCSTPAGRNDFWRQFTEVAKGEREGWGYLWADVRVSGVFPPEKMEKERQDYINTGREEEFEREYHCNFDAPIAGAIYGKQIEKLRKEGDVCVVPHDPSRKVITSWDLGIKDDTAIWFWQIERGGRVRVIDFLSGSGVALSVWCERVNSKPYDYDFHILPHDARRRDQTSGTSFEDHMDKLRMPKYILKQGSVPERIEAARRVLAVSIFDGDKCASGLEALSLYEKKWSSERQAFEKMPHHNWTSHAADAFGYGAQFVCVKLGMKNPESLMAKSRKHMTDKDWNALLNKGNPQKKLIAGTGTGLGPRRF